MKQQLNI